MKSNESLENGHSNGLLSLAIPHNCKFQKGRESENQGFVNYMRESKRRCSIEGGEGGGSRRGSFGKMMKEGLESGSKSIKGGYGVGNNKSTDKNGRRGKKALKI